MIQILLIVVNVGLILWSIRQLARLRIQRREIAEEEVRIQALLDRIRGKGTRPDDATP